VLIFLEHDRNFLLCVNIRVIILVVGPVRSVQVSVEGHSYMENSDKQMVCHAASSTAMRVTVHHVQNCELQDTSCYFFIESTLQIIIRNTYAHTPY